MPANGFKWVEDLSKFNEYFIKIYNEKCNKWHFLEVIVVQYPILHEVHNDLSILSETKKFHKIKKPVANLADKKEYIIHIRNLKKTLIHGLVLRKFQFNQKAWLESNILFSHHMYIVHELLIYCTD